MTDSLQRLLTSLILITLLASPSLFANETTLYWTPDASQTAAFTIASDSPLLQDANAVLGEELAQAGWFWIEKPGMYQGYVRSSDIGKGLQLAVGSIIFLEQDAQSPVLTSVQVGDSLSLEQVGEEWSLVEFTKAIPLYFKKSSTATAPQASKDDAVTDTEAPTVTNDSPADSDLADPIEPISDQAVPNTDPTPSDETEQLGFTIAPSPTIELPQPKISPVQKVPGMKTIQGVLKEYKPWLFRKSPYNYQLVSPSGTRIAFVDTGALILHQPIQNLLGQKVNVQGHWEKAEGDKYLTIKARLLSPRNPY